MKKSLKIKKSETLIREGDTSKSVYYLKSGALEVRKIRGNKMVKIGTIVAGEVVGEMSFIDKSSRSATVVALSDSELIEIPEEALSKEIKNLPPWLKAFFNTILERLRKANTKIKD